MGCIPGQPGSQDQRRIFERPPVFGYDLNPISIATNFTGGAVNTAWPNLKKMAEKIIQNDIGAVGLVFATSILQPVADKIVGCFVLIGEGPDTIAADKSGILLPHLTQMNSPAAGTPNPTNKTSSLSFGENSAIRINSGQKVCIYASGDNIAQIFAAVLTIYTIALDKR